MKTIIQTLFFFLLAVQIGFGQWVQVGLNSEGIKDIATKDATIFAVTADNGKLFRSTDSGVNWTRMVDSCAYDVAISGTGKIFMIKDTLTNFPLQEGRSFYSSTDNGETWLWSNAEAQLADSFDYVYPNNITVTPEGNVILTIFYPFSMNLFIGFAISNDDGLTWPTPGPSVVGGLNFDFKNQQMITLGYTYGPTSGHGELYLSSDYGTIWNRLGDPPANYSYAIGFFTNGNIIMGTDWGHVSPPGVHISEDFCNTWTQIAKINCKMGVSWSSGPSEGMLIGTEDLGVFLFSDEGDSLGTRNEGLTNLNVQALTLDNNGYVYAGTGNGVWRRPLSEVTPVEENQILIPAGFNLSQNYPNPFNPSSKIKYSVPQSSQVQIKVFDVLGNGIETLVNEEKPTGNYELIWNSSSLPSGVYFYQLRAGNYIDTKKMILLK